MVVGIEEEVFWGEMVVCGGRIRWRCSSSDGNGWRKEELEKGGDGKCGERNGGLDC